MKKKTDLQNDIYIFNPTCELAIANGNFSYMPPRMLQRFETDLQVIPAYFAKANDYVVVNDYIDNDWQNFMKFLGFNLPKFILKEELHSPQILNNNIGFLKPWGWSPVAHNIFKDVKSHCSHYFKNTPNFNWSKEQKELYSRKTSLNIYKELITDNKLDFISGIEDTPIICYSLADVQENMNRYEKIIVKAPWSSSGRGILIILGKKLSIPDSQWISGILKSQKYIMLEELRDKIFDISFHYHISQSTGVNYIGNASFTTDNKGAYIGNNLQAVPANIDYEIKEFLTKDKIEIISNLLEKALNKSPLADKYYGYLGIDAYIYRTKEGLKVFPCVEINLRYNMGTLNLKIRDFVHPNSEGMIITDRILNNTVSNFISEMKNKYPISYKDNKPFKGFIPLTPAKEDTVFINYLLMK